MDVDWEALGCLLADSLAKPAFVLDRSGTIRMVNAAAERATGWRRQAVIGAHWCELLTPTHPRSDNPRWATDALRGMIKEGSFRARAEDGAPLAIEFDISPVGDGDAKALLLVATRMAIVDLSAEPATIIRYQLSTASDSFGVLDYVATESQTRYLAGRELRCFNYLYELDKPCRNCPALPGAKSTWPSVAVRAHATRDDCFEVVHAVQVEGDAVQVHVRRISDAELRRLFSAKLERIGENANLTAREHAVLEHLMAGRGPEEIATLLSVSKRTVKFHQANILEKLGAESRNDILRLLL
jgi:PAS domain S-box-containing protein